MHVVLPFMAESFLPTPWSPSPPISFRREVVVLPMRVEDDEGTRLPLFLFLFPFVLLGQKLTALQRCLYNLNNQARQLKLGASSTPLRYLSNTKQPIEEADS
jgi:hypothetical protein